MIICSSRVHCVACRTNDKFRANLVSGKLAATIDFDCPFGVTEESARQALAARPRGFEVRSSNVFTPAGGPATWEELHTYIPTGTKSDAAFLASFSRRVTGEKCSCNRDWRAWLSHHPVRWDDYFGWSVEAHNAVNIRIGKPVVDAMSAMIIWRSVRDDNHEQIDHHDKPDNEQGND